MTPKCLDEQVDRIRAEWPHSYGDSRKLRLWELYRDVPDEVFRDAVTELIDTHRGGAPVPRDFERPVELARARWKQREWAKPVRSSEQPSGRPPDLAKVKSMVAALMEHLDGKKGSPDCRRR